MHTFVLYGTCPLTCIHKKTCGGLCYTLPIEVPDLPIDHPRENLFDSSLLMSESDKQFQEKCVDLSHYEIHHAHYEIHHKIQQDEMSQKIHQLPFHLWDTSPHHIDSLSDSACELLWQQRLIHCGEHTLRYIHNHVDGVSNLSKIKFNDLNHCATCLKATLTNSPAGYHSLRDLLTTLYQGLYVVFVFPGRISKDKDKKIIVISLS